MLGPDNGLNEEKPPMIIIEDKEVFYLCHILQHRPLYKQKGDSNFKYLITSKGYEHVYIACQVQESSL